MNTEDSDGVINSPEVMESLSNMLIVRVNGETKTVSASEKNKLLYEHNLYELLHPGSRNKRVVLRDSDDDSEFIAIGPTENDSVYRLWFGRQTYPIMNQPSKASDVLRAVNAALGDYPDYEPFRNVFNEIRSNQVRRRVIQSAESMFSQTEIVPTEEGWEVLGLFLITWDARIFLNTEDAGKHATYQIGVREVTETEKTRQFISLSVGEEVFKQYSDLSLKASAILDEQSVTNRQPVDNDCPTCDDENVQLVTVSRTDKPDQDVFKCESCDQAWEEHKLTEREIEFIGKVKWLIQHREQLDDDTFWTVIEKYVWHGPNK